MSSLWPLTLLALATVPWWWPVWRTLVDDLFAASEPDAARLPIAGAPLGPPPRAESRVPLNRLLAFQGVRRRVAARQRWEGGFGRRGL